MKEVRERQMPYDLNYMWNLKNKTKTDIKNKWVVARGEGVEGGGNR